MAKEDIIRFSKTLFKPHTADGKLLPEAEENPYKAEQAEQAGRQNIQERNPFSADSARSKLRGRGEQLNDIIKQQTGG